MGTVQTAVCSYILFCYCWSQRENLLCYSLKEKKKEGRGRKLGRIFGLVDLRYYLIYKPVRPVNIMNLPRPCLPLSVSLCLPFCTTFTQCPFMSFDVFVQTLEL